MAIAASHAALTPARPTDPRYFATTWHAVACAGGTDLLPGQPCPAGRLPIPVHGVLLITQAATDSDDP